jgi:hypothetical protein
VNFGQTADPPLVLAVDLAEIGDEKSLFSIGFIGG